MIKTASHVQVEIWILGIGNYLEFGYLELGICSLLRYPIDLAIAIDHLTLCAAAEGLGTCWIGAFDEGKVKEILGIPKPIRTVELLPLGYPRDPSPVNKIRFALQKIVMYEQW